MSIFYRPLETVKDLTQLSALESAVWGMAPIPIHQTLTVAKNGGVVIGAFDEAQLVGFVYSFPGFKNGDCYLCSHMMGIDPRYRNQGIGYQLKLQQATEARKYGYRKIQWTFDPLESRNARLNIAKLGGVCREYIVDCYGEMDDGLNQGLPTDRFLVEWRIDESRDWVPSTSIADPSQILLDWRTRGDGFPEAVICEMDADRVQQNRLYVAAPRHFQDIKQSDMSLAIDWRLKVREVFLRAFASGWAVRGVMPPAGVPVQYYELAK